MKLWCCYLRCPYLNLRAESSKERLEFVFLNSHTLSIEQGLKNGGVTDKLSFLRTRREVRTLQMKATLRKRMTVEMRKRMKKLMMIFAVS